MNRATPYNTAKLHLVNKRAALLRGPHHLGRLRHAARRGSEGDL